MKQRRITGMLLHKQIELFKDWRKHLLLEHQDVTCTRPSEEILEKFKIYQEKKGKSRIIIKEAVKVNTKGGSGINNKTNRRHSVGKEKNHISIKVKLYYETLSYVFKNKYFFYKPFSLSKIYSTMNIKCYNDTILQQKYKSIINL